MKKKHNKTSISPHNEPKPGQNLFYRNWEGGLKLWQSWWVKKGEEESRKEKRRREDEVSVPERDWESLRTRGQPAQLWVTLQACLTFSSWEICIPHLALDAETNRVGFLITHIVSHTGEASGSLQVHLVLDMTHYVLHLKHQHSSENRASLLCPPVS